MLIEFQTKKKVDIDALTGFAKKAHRAAGLKGDVDILITSDAEMKKLNRQFRRKNKATDVISFPASAEGVSGDIAISADIADDNARRLGHSLTQEFQILLLHGMLHLAGHDHETDSGAMEGLESRLRARFGLKDSLILRSQVTERKQVKSQAVKKRAAADRIRRLRPATRKTRPKRKP